MFPLLSIIIIIMTKWVYKLVFCPVFLVVATLRKTESDLFVFETAAPTMITSWNVSKPLFCNVLINTDNTVWSYFIQLQPNSASGSGALEHDPSSIYLRVPVGEAIPGPLPLGVSVIDASVALFGVVFPHVSFKHRCDF